MASATEITSDIVVTATTVVDVFGSFSSSARARKNELFREK
jgi:hypothetical protein